MRIAGLCWGVALCVIVAGATPADESLPASRAAARALEARDALPLTDFYEPPQPLPSAAPGTLIRAQRFIGYQLPPGAAAIRILYHSLALNGTDVAVSGVVLVPAGTAPPDGWPLIAWAHGTSGVARSCAPSLMKDLEYGEEGLMPMVAAGFAVVATDYAGLGTPTAHQYDNKRAQANDVVYSVIAAHAALADLGASWVAIGHSQGGVAVWGVAELEAARHDPGYAGAISVAGDMNFEAFEAHDAKTFNAVTDLYWPLTAFGIHASYPSFDVRRMLTAPVLARYRDVTTQGCWYYAYAALAEIGTRRAVKPGWDTAPEVRKYNDDNRSANRPIQGPLLVLAGDDDRSVAIANIEVGVRQACSLGLPIEFVHRPGLDHDPLMEKTTPLQLDWVRDRLAGKPWSSNCAPATQLQNQYQQAIGEAAVRHPDWNIALWSFGSASVVKVSTLTDDPALDTVTQHNWVAATAEVRPRCQGTSDALLFLEQLLGLPPAVTPSAGKRWHVYTFDVAQAAMFRPCPGGVDTSTPERPRCLAGTSLAATLDPATARFLLQQFWYSHRRPSPGGGADEFGYPWTGMGWTYDWDPQSKTHVGVSEFVVRPGASVSQVRDETPAQFCSIE